MLRIRAATIADAHSVARIHVSAWRTTYRGMMPEDVLARLDMATRTQHWRKVAEAYPVQLLVLERDGHVVGFCHIAAALDADAGKDVGEITALYVDESAKGQRGGRSLCVHALNQLRERGFSEAILWVLRENRAARAFYEKLGFTPDGGHKYIEALQVEGVRYRIRLGGRDPSK